MGVISKNDITGDFLVSGVNSKEYTEKFEKIFPENFGSIVVLDTLYEKCGKRCWLESYNDKPVCDKPNCKNYL